MRRFFNVFFAIFLIIQPIHSTPKTSSDYTIFNLGIQPALFTTNAGISINILNLFYGFGVYANRYGMGTFSKYQKVISVDENLHEFIEQTSAWRATTIGITYKIYNNLYLFGGLCDGEFQKLNSYKTVLGDDIHYSEKKEFEYFPGNEFGIQYEIKNIKDKFSITVVIGLNYALTASDPPVSFLENPVLFTGIGIGVIRKK